jgi:hypothetical protein
MSLLSPQPVAATRTDRRRFLTRATSGLLSALALSRAGSVIGSETAEKSPRKTARHCILVYLLGGPSHLDMWDPKPSAPAEIRGPFEAISTAVPGLHFTEHLPLLAQRADRLAIVRSVSHDNNDHPYMAYYTLTGRISPVALGANTVLPPSRSDDPHIGAIVSKFKHADPSVPGYVAIPELTVRMAPVPVAGGGRAGFLGPRFDPLPVNDDPTRPIASLALPSGVTAARMNGREELLALLDGRTLGAARAADYAATRRTAMRLTRSIGGGGMFDLSAESAALGDSYGRNRFGQSLLLSRRLVERGVSFVGVHFNYMSKCDGWDTHKNNFACLKHELLPLLDRGVSALLDDLAMRGLLDDTLVVVMGEFGRTPKINADAGRDHWGPCGSVVFAGGGVNRGVSVGASDKFGAYPTLQPVSPPDITATIFQALGLDPKQLMSDAQGRPLAISTGTPVAQLFG